MQNTYNCKSISLAKVVYLVGVYSLHYICTVIKLPHVHCTKLRSMYIYRNNTNNTMVTRRLSCCLAQLYCYPGHLILTILATIFRICTLYIVDTDQLILSILATLYRLSYPSSLSILVTYYRLSYPSSLSILVSFSRLSQPSSLSILVTFYRLSYPSSLSILVSFYRLSYPSSLSILVTFYRLSYLSSLSILVTF